MPFEASDNDDIKRYSEANKNDSKDDSCQCSECNGIYHSYLDDDYDCNFDEDDEVNDLDCKISNWCSLFYWSYSGSNESDQKKEVKREVFLSFLFILIFT